MIRIQHSGKHTRKGWLVIGLLCGVLLTSSFDWKAQPNEALRKEMMDFASSFCLQVKGTPAEKTLKKFYKQQQKKAFKEPYAWMEATHEVVAKLKQMYPPVIASNPTGESQLENAQKALIRKRALQLLDYPLHVDNLNKESPTAEKHAFEQATRNYVTSAWQNVLTRLGAPLPASGMEIIKVYNMGYIFRTAQHTIGVDLRWDAKEIAPLVEHLDALFLTHPHNDHYSLPVLQAMAAAGKPVILPGKMDVQGQQVQVWAEAKSQPVTVAGIKVLSFPGNQGEGIPCNVYLFDIDGYRVIHQGDNYDREQESRLADYPVADVLIVSTWNEIHHIMQVACSAQGADKQKPLLIPSHENEMGHGVRNRESYREMFQREDRLGDPQFDYPHYLLMDIGESFLYLKN